MAISDGNVTLIHVYKGEHSLLELFNGRDSLNISELIPAPPELRALTLESWLHFELLFGDEDEAIKGLDELFIEVSDVEAYKRKEDVRSDAALAMQAASEFGVPDFATWRQQNWGGNDRPVKLTQIAPFMVLTVTGHLKEVAHQLMTRVEDASYELIHQVRNPLGSVEIARLNEQSPLHPAQSSAPERPEGSVLFTA